LPDFDIFDGRWHGGVHPWQVERAKKKLQERRDEETPSSHFLKHKTQAL
jgi:hypothetical protein